ncbi:MAG: ATP-binding protein [Cetobacterium sp.]
MDLTQIIQGLKKRSQQYQEQQLQDGKESKVSIPKCSKCDDVGFIHRGNNVWVKCDCIVRKELEQRFKNAGINLDEIKNLEEYEIYNTITAKAKVKTEDYIKNFSEFRKDRKNGFTLLGQAGGGKTLLNLIIAKALIEKNISIRYMGYLEGIRSLKSLTLNNEAYEKKFNEYVNCDVLIIDDLFKNKILNGKLKNGLTEADLNHIMPIINQRYINHKPMIISSECTGHQLLELDGATGGRIIEASKEIITFDRSCNYREKMFLKK